jgi:hypothetical protein
MERGFTFQRQNDLVGFAILNADWETFLPVEGSMIRTRIPCGAARKIRVRRTRFRKHLTKAAGDARKVSDAPACFWPPRMVLFGALSSNFLPSGVASVGWHSVG